MRPVLCIDPGHGGNNLGTTQGGLVEKDVTIELARELALSLHGIPVDVILTRYEDEPLSQAQRGALSASQGADFVISIHVNAGRFNLSGFDCFYWPGSAAGLLVARTIAESAPISLRTGRTWATDDEPWKKDARAICGAHKAPTVLAEVGYSTNTRDAKYLASDVGRHAIVCALRAGAVKAVEWLTVRR